MRRLIRWILVTIIIACRPAFAEESASLVEQLDQTSEYQVETLVESLDNPFGIVVRPSRFNTGKFELLFSESGAGKILKFSTQDPGKLEEVITGFPTDRFNQELPLRVGPLGLEFLNSRSKLIVGNSGVPNGADVVGVYILAADGEVIEASKANHFVGPLKGGSSSDSGYVNFLAMTKTETTLYLSVGGDDDSGVILKSGLESNKLAYVQPLPGDRNKNRRSCGGITTIPSPQPPYLVVAEMGSFDRPNDSSLVFYVPATGKVGLELPTGLHDIMSLAYSPSGQLYAADFAWNEEEAGGIYRIDDMRVDGKQGCRAVKIAELVHPTSMAFTPDGVLYATACGPGENDQVGQVVRITGDL